MIKRTLISLVFILGLLPLLQAQQALLQEDVNPDNPLETNLFSRNGAHFVYGFISWGPSLNIDEIENVPFVSGGNYQFGTRYKRKIGGALAFQSGASLSFHSNSYDEEAILGGLNFNPELYRAKARWYFFSMEAGPRINFNPGRGNDIGTYLDLKVYASYLLGRSMVIRSRFEDDTRTTMRQRKYETNTPLVYGVEASLGINHWAIKASYQLQELQGQDTKAPYPELLNPQFQVFRLGIEFAMF